MSRIHPTLLAAGCIALAIALWASPAAALPSCALYCTCSTKCSIACNEVDGPSTCGSYGVCIGACPDPCIEGTDGNDNLSGTSGNDCFEAYAGHDTISGGGGQDDIDCGSGNDTAYGGSSGDYIAGGSGDDSLYAGFSGDDWCDGGSGNDTCSCEAEVYCEY